jgi:hypothetical protein
MSIVTQVQNILNDTGVFWPTQNLFDAINEAQWWLFADIRWQRTSATVTLSSNADVFGIPANILIPEWLEGQDGNFQPTTYKRFYPSTMRELEQFLRTWRGNNTGQPQYFVRWDATHMRVFPRPDGLGPAGGGNYTFTMWGIGFPGEITNTSQDISGLTTLVNDSYTQAIQNMSAALLFEATRPDLADAFLAVAMENSQLFKRTIRNMQGHNIRRLRPADHYDKNHSGTVNDLPVYYPLES